MPVKCINWKRAPLYTHTHTLSLEKKTQNLLDKLTELKLRIEIESLLD